MKYFKLIIIISLFQLGKSPVYGQSKAMNRDKYQIHITSIDEKINLDGLLDEKIWQVAEKT